MKKIQPENIWINGVKKPAKYMTLSGTDNFKDSATFYYVLFAETTNKEGENIQGEKLVDGNLTITGKDYENWQTNQDAWDWAAKQLGLTLIQETEKLK